MASRRGGSRPTARTRGRSGRTGPCAARSTSCGNRAGGWTTPGAIRPSGRSLRRRLLRSKRDNRARFMCRASVVANRGSSGVLRPLFPPDRRLFCPDAVLVLPREGVGGCAESRRIVRRLVAGDARPVERFGGRCGAGEALDHFTQAPFRLTELLPCER